ncbi:hypothetical protein DFH09DRAFT_561106 [Mycena vulgaris]|nr:hypothetical protein DFH09DRAFT_561106 [Mycena vulgaris]
MPRIFPILFVYPAFISYPTFSKPLFPTTFVFKSWGRLRVLENTFNIWLLKIAPLSGAVDTSPQRVISPGLAIKQ